MKKQFEISSTVRIAVELVFKMRALITGGAGFIGSHLLERLVSRARTKM